MSLQHVITACHCVTGSSMYDDKNTIKNDSLFVSPIFDNGEKSAYFDCSWVDKIYFFENWQFIYNDIAILELENPIGEETGWLSVGFNENDEELLDGIFYKFSYPARPLYPTDEYIYNGDTMYYNYGIADHIEKSGIGILKTSGIPGESGSSLIKIKNRENYTVYGTLNLSNDLRHTRITNFTYNTIKSILDKETDLPDSNNRIEDGFSVYPNPASNRIKIQNKDGINIHGITLFDATGRNVGRQTVNGITVDYDISHLPNGLYFLHIETPSQSLIKKVMKSGK